MAPVKSSRFMGREKEEGGNETAKTIIIIIFVCIDDIVFIGENTDSIFCLHIAIIIMIIYLKLMCVLLSVCVIVTQ